MVIEQLGLENTRQAIQKWQQSKREGSGIWQEMSIAEILGIGYLLTPLFNRRSTNAEWICTTLAGLRSIIPGKKAGKGVSAWHGQFYMKLCPTHRLEKISRDAKVKRCGFYSVII